MEFTAAHVRNPDFQKFRTAMKKLLLQIPPGRELPQNHPVQWADNSPVRSKAWLTKAIREFYAYCVSVGVTEEETGWTMETFRVPTGPLVPTCCLEPLYDYLKSKFGDMKIVLEHAESMLWSAAEHRAAEKSVEFFANFMTGVWENRVMQMLLRTITILDVLPVAVRYVSAAAATGPAAGATPSAPPAAGAAAAAAPPPPPPDPALPPTTPTPTTTTHYVPVSVVPQLLRILFGPESPAMEFVVMRGIDALSRGVDGSDNRWSTVKNMSKMAQARRLGFESALPDLRDRASNMRVVSVMHLYRVLCEAYTDKLRISALA